MSIEQSQQAAAASRAEIFLQQQGIGYQPVCASRAPDAQQAISVLLTDEKHELAAFLPGNRILDLRLLNAQLDASLEWDKSADARIKNKLKSTTLPAIAQLLERPCIVDSQLLEQPQVFLESGQPGILLQISQSDFSALLHSAEFLLFSQPVPCAQPNLLPSSLEQEHGNDGIYSLTTLRIKQKLLQTVRIPPLSDTAQKVLQLRTDPNACVDELTGIIETDPAMAAQVMSWASSPYYAAPGKVRSIEDAIIRVLGFDLVINLALGLSLGKSLQLPKNDSSTSRDYWQSAIYTAALIEGLALLVPRHKQPEIGLTYLCGLLHSFGYVLLAYLFPGYFQLTSQYLNANQHLPVSQVEYFLLGITREQMGAWLMQHWKMPSELTVAIGQQFNPDYQGEHAVYAQLTFLAKQMLARQEQRPYEIPASLYQQLGITEQQAQQALEQVLAAEKALRSLAAQFTS